MSGVISLEVSHPSGSPEPFQVIMMEDAWVGTLRDQNVLLDGGGWAGFLFLDEPGVFSEVALCIAPPELPEQVAVKVEIRDSGAGFSVGMAAYLSTGSQQERGAARFVGRGGAPRAWFTDIQRVAGRPPIAVSWEEFVEPGHGLGGPIVRP